MTGSIALLLFCCLINVDKYHDTGNVATAITNWTDQQSSAYLTFGRLAFTVRSLLRLLVPWDSTSCGGLYDSIPTTAVLSMPVIAGIAMVATANTICKDYS